MSLLTSDYVADWYLLRSKINSPLSEEDDYYLVKSINNTTSISTDQLDLIQGDAGVLVIDQKEQKEKTSISGDALILKNSSGVNNVETNSIKYYDIIDLMKYDYYKILQHLFLTPEDLFIKQSNFQTLGITLAQFGEAINNTNLLSSAQINLGDTVSVTLNYETRYDNKFDIVLANETYYPRANFDFIGRIARNFDCRFYIDGQQYRIKSGSINISIGYQELWIANTYTKLPFYSPQKHSVTGSLEIIALHNEIESMKSEGNCSVLIGDRYIELGQASVKNNYTRSLQAGSSPTTVSVEFQAYARLGAGLDSVRWSQYYLNILNNSDRVLYDNITKLNILNFLKDPSFWVNKP